MLIRLQILKSIFRKKNQISPLNNKGGKMLDKYFNYKKHKTDFKTEVIAGVTTFLTMAYIMFLNPFILSGEFAGPEKGFFDFGAVYTATILATALACFIMAFYGKTWPVGLAPGMGINAFVAFGVCAGMGYTPQEALGAVLVAGVLFLIISLTPIRAWLINSIPKSLKLRNWSWYWIVFSNYWITDHGSCC